VLLKELDLNNPGTFRDLSRPMGAQTPDRLKQFEKRYNDWDDPTGSNIFIQVISSLL
jgi:WD repeat and FYVE domain-containing protein 3